MAINDSLVQYVTFPSRLHSKLKVAGRQVFRLKKFDAISNMHITIIIIIIYILESDSSRHLHSLVPSHSPSFEENALAFLFLSLRGPPEV